MKKLAIGLLLSLILVPTLAAQIHVLSPEEAYLPEPPVVTVEQDGDIVVQE